MKQYIDKYLSLIQGKHELRKDDRKTGTAKEFYLQWLQDEIVEVQEEIKPDNHVYLEDELGDIMRDFMNVLFYLKHEGKIHSVHNVFEKSLQKYTERMNDQHTAQKSGEVDARKTTKERQKQRLRKQHQQFYGKVD